MKVVVYKEEDISTLLSALDKIHVTGIEQARLIVYISEILKDGELKNRHEPQGAEGAKK